MQCSDLPYLLIYDDGVGPVGMQRGFDFTLFYFETN